MWTFFFARVRLPTSPSKVRRFAASHSHPCYISCIYRRYLSASPTYLVLMHKSSRNQRNEFTYTQPQITTYVHGLLTPCKYCLIRSGNLTPNPTQSKHETDNIISLYAASKSPPRPRSWTTGRFTLDICSQNFETQNPCCCQHVLRGISSTFQAVRIRGLHALLFSVELSDLALLTLASSGHCI